MTGQTQAFSRLWHVGLASVRCKAEAPRWGGERPLTVLGEDLALLDMLHEITLALIDAGGEALLESAVDGAVDFLALGLIRENSLLFFSPLLSAFLAAELAAEVRGFPALLVEVDGVC